MENCGGREYRLRKSPTIASRCGRLMVVVLWTVASPRYGFGGSGAISRFQVQCAVEASQAAQGIGISSPVHPACERGSPSRWPITEHIGLTLKVGRPDKGQAWI